MESPRDLAARQVELDAARVRDPVLAERKRTRMLASPLAFLRGAAPLFYEILKAEPRLAAGPDGTSWIAGDLHIENFGAYRPGALVGGDEEESDVPRAVFDLNDFDDATIAPARLDVLRLVTSLLLGTRDLASPGLARVTLARALLDAHSAAIAGSAEEPAEPASIVALLDRVRTRTRKALLDARTVPGPNGRRFVRGPRYRDLSMALLRDVASAFQRYTQSLPSEIRPQADALVVIDAAFRVAGTGSLGATRIAVLTKGKGGPDGCFVFDLKEQGEPSSTILFRAPEYDPATRVRTAAQAMAHHPPRMLGETELGGVTCLGRRLAPQEDHLDWTQVGSDDLEALARRLGWLAGRAHRRSLTTALSQAWTAGDRQALLDNAVELAGLHESIYLAYAAS